METIEIEYTATFHSHFDAVKFGKFLKSNNIRYRMMPVPRKLSSSCGTCVRFWHNAPFVSYEGHEVEKLLKTQEDQFILIYEGD